MEAIKNFATGNTQEYKPILPTRSTGSSFTVDDWGSACCAAGAVGCVCTAAIVAGLAKATFAVGLGFLFSGGAMEFAGYPVVNPDYWWISGTVAGCGAAVWLTFACCLACATAATKET
ncbi:MAG: hypothetical protein KDK78_07235 [Chlamydiia bacterium]|nr:hypothetical protein [Chlamydiia bacterium]